MFFHTLNRMTVIIAVSYTHLDCVHLGGVAAVGQYKAVHAELPVGGAVAEVAAVGKAIPIHPFTGHAVHR